MYARVVQAMVKPGKMDEFLRMFKDEFAPEIQKDAGFAQSFLTREGDSIAVMTVYAAKADVDATDPLFRARVAKALDLFTGPPQASTREVVVHLG
jgi:heme-degrading monooxygenase HmoA